MKQKHEDLSKGVPNPDDLNPPSQRDGTNQSRKVDPRKDGTGQARTVELMQKSEDFDHIDKENPFVKMAGGSQRTARGA